MRFSVIIPIYNVENYLHKCIESVVNQTLKDYELFLIDDCSSDNSLKIAEEYENNEAVTLIRKEKNSGLSDTRNYGLRKANGDYILFLDSDDYIEFDALEKIDRLISSNKYPDIIYFDYFMHVDTTVSKKRSNHCAVTMFTGTAFLKEELSKRKYNPAACFGVYRRDLIMRKNLFFKVGILHEDELWAPQIALTAEKVYISDYAYYHYIRHSGSITLKSNQKKNGIDIMKICKDLDKVSKKVTDNELKNIMDNHIAMLYMKALTIGKLFETDSSNIVDRTYPLKRAYFFKDKIKAVIFATNFKLYYFLNTIGEK